jgi:YbbR domain-containing protein
MKKFFVTNVGWKLTSLLLAFLLWIAVAQQPELTTSIAVPILFRNVPSDLELASEVVDRAHLEIRGPAGRLTAANLAQVAVVFDVATLHPGERSFNIRPRMVWGLPLGVVFYRAVPSQVNLRFEHQIVKEVPVTPNYDQPEPPGYVVSSYHINPVRVKIRGPEEWVKDVDSVATDPIDLKKLIQDGKVSVHVHLPNDQVRLESSSTVVFFGKIEKVSNKESK